MLSNGLLYTILRILIYRQKNEELTNNLAKIADKARQDYGANAKRRAMEEKAKKDKILNAEKKKKDEANKGFFARLFGF